MVIVCTWACEDCYGEVRAAEKSTRPRRHHRHSRVKVWRERRFACERHAWKLRGDLLSHEELEAERVAAALTTGADTD